MAAPPVSAASSVDPGAPEVKVGARQWYTLSILTLAYVLCLMDRKLPFILVEPIRKDLHLSDTQIGLITGLMFTLVYSTSAIPVARLADRFSRKWVMTWSILAWSALTSLGGFAQNFWHLAFARAGVAVGESGCMPAAHSMLSDTFPERQRSTAAALFMAGAPIGILIGLAAGGVIADLFDWRMAMIVIGAPGLIIGLLFAFTIKEPVRSEARKDQPKVGIWTAAKVLFARPAFFHLAMAGMINSLAGTAIQSFGPAFIMRTYGLSTTQTGISYGLLLGIGGLIGALAGGVVADRLRGRGEKAGLWFVTAVVAIAGPLQIAAWFAPNYMWFLILLFVPQIANMIYAGPVYPALQALAGPRMRAMSVALYLFLLNGVGQSLGPLLAGGISDLLKPSLGPASLQWSLLILASLKLWAAVHYVFAALSITRDLVHARKRQADEIPVMAQAAGDAV
ncbi:MAG: hypothetical protein JWR84_3065 [Caulobacter sp.]|nr:hypothetical protein [Caulobacter sp.]